MGGASMTDYPTYYNIIAAVVCLVVLGGLTLLRSATRGKVEIKPADALIAVVPFVLWLVMSGQVSKASVGPDGIALEAITNASNAKIEAQIQDVGLPVTPIDMIEKMGGDPE